MSASGDVALVTGGAGFLGAALVRVLVGKGRTVRVLDDHSRGGPDRLADLRGKFESIAGDVRDEALVKRAARGCATVFHLAAVNGTRFFYEQPERVLDVALRGTLAAVIAAREAKARRFLFASSGEVYHDPPTIPTPEDVRCVVPDPSNPRFSYSGGKLAGELITRNYLRDAATGAIVFRPHNVYGPAMGFEHVIPNLVHKIRDAAARAGASATKPKVEIELQGTGKETRAFCWVDDAAEAIALLEAKGEPGATYHVGTEEEIAIADLARRLGTLRGLEVVPRAGPAPAGAPLRRCADTRKLRALGFAARTPLDEGLAKTLAWYWTHDAPKAGGA